MRSLICLLIGSTLATAQSGSPLAPADNPAPLTAKAVLHAISMRGAKVVLAEAWSVPSRFDAICSGISSGTRPWLRVAVLLRPVSDAGAALSLDLSVAGALPKAPGPVLSLTTHGFTLRQVCLPGLIEPAPGVERAHFEASARALNVPIAADLEPLRRACLLLVQGRLEELKAGGQ